LSALSATVIAVAPGPRPALFLLFAAAALASMPAAATTFASAVKTNDARELAQWGRRFEHGEGVDRDVDHAIRLYCKAAARGDASAHYHLGWIYAVGRAGERDDALAAAWFHRAAQKNDAHAKRMLDRLGHKGKPSRDAVCLLSDGSRANADGGIVGPRRYAGRGGTRQVSITRPHPAKGRVAKMVRDLAPEYRLNPNLVLAVIEAESNFNPHARSPKNAQGLMQLIPATAERFGVRNVWDPEENVRGGMAYLRWLMRYFDGDLELVLAAYNAGEGAVERHGGIPPYAETQSYVKRIIRRLN
jgi:hypothetical protein